MPKRYAYSFTLTVLTAVVIGFAFQADGALMVFYNRDSFQSALGGGAGVQFNFNGFDSNASFASSALNFGSFNLSAIGIPPLGTDLIETGPSDDSIDDTPFASMFLDSTRSVALDFNQPALAFGGEFVGAAYNFGVFLAGSRSATILEGTTTDRQFFGVVSTEPISRILFLYSGPEGSNTTVNFDNIQITQAVPEPSSLMLLGIGSVLLATYGCRRWRSGKMDVAPDGPVVAPEALPTSRS